MVMVAGKLAGDDPTWSPDGFVTRAFPDSSRGGGCNGKDFQWGKDVTHCTSWKKLGRFCDLRNQAQIDSLESQITVSKYILYRNHLHEWK